MNSRTDIDLQIDFTGAVLVKWTGCANESRPGAGLAPVFDKLLAMGRYVRFDFTELKHISSSTLVVIMKFFKQLNALGVGFDFRYDEAASWQRMTFAPLAALSAPPARPRGRRSLGRRLIRARHPCSQKRDPCAAARAFFWLVRAPSARDVGPQPPSS